MTDKVMDKWNCLVLNTLLIMKPKNGTAAKDKSETMMNLLDSTDSDVEWLNLPPIKGKKPKKWVKKAEKVFYQSMCIL